MPIAVKPHDRSRHCRSIVRVVEPGELGIFSPGAEFPAIDIFGNSTKPGKGYQAVKEGDLPTGIVFKHLKRKGVKSPWVEVARYRFDGLELVKLKEGDIT